jgi:hypothetical protein
MLYSEKKFRKGYFHYLSFRTKKKPKSVVRKELTMVRNYWNYPPYHYYRYKLYQRDLTEDQLLDYIPPFYYFNIYWENRHRELDKTLYQSKIFQNHLFAKLNIPSPQVFAVVKNGRLYASENVQITIKDLIDNNIKTDNGSLFCKPEFGRGGIGIVHLIKKGNSIHVNGKPVSNEEIMSFFKNDEKYIVQEGFIQSREMDKINKSSVNTLRIYTQFKDDKVVLPACILRMGVNNSFVDNLSQGGLMNVINVEDGSLADYAQIKLEDRKYYEHPDSKYVFKNARIENWAEIKSQIISYSYLLSECKDLGWDVAIGDNGFKVLEINIAHGMDHPQMIFGGMRRLLGVYPEKY